MTTENRALRRRRRESPIANRNSLSLMAKIIITLLAIIQVLPFIFTVSQAFKPMDELFLFPPRPWVQRPTMANFRSLFMATSDTWVPFSRYIFNTVFTTIAIVAISIIIGSMAAYPLSKYSRAPGMGIIFTAIILTLTFPAQVTSIPKFIIMSRLRLIDTYWALILPTVGGTYGVFLLKQFLDASIPNELLEVARIDGANEFQVYWHIIMPNTQPAWSTLAIISFQMAWGDAGSALIYTRSEAMRTLPLALQTIGTGIGRAGAVAAAALITALPGIIVFIFFQRRVIETMVHSGIKA